MQVVVERLRVRASQLRLGVEPRGERIHLTFRRAYTGSAREVVAHRFARPWVRLLREVADRSGADELAAIGLLEPREHAEQGRLADPVRADDADAVSGRDDQRHAVQHLDRGIRLRDVTGGDRARHERTSLRAKGEKKRGFGLEIRHGAPAERASAV